MEIHLRDGDLSIDGEPFRGVRDAKMEVAPIDPPIIAPLTLTYLEAERIAKFNLETSVQRCVCGWFDREYTFPTCPNCGTSLDELTAWWSEMDDRFWGMSKDELREDFETWRILNADVVA